MTATEQLKDVISNGVARDIFAAEQTLFLEQGISENSEAINTAAFGDFFGSIQSYLSRQLIISVARLYETNNRYPIKSIPAALKILKENAEDLPIPERPTLEKELIKKGYQPEKLNALERAELTNLVATHLEGQIPKVVKDSEITLERALHALKTIRDKAVAHHEAIAYEELPRITYEQIIELIETAKDFVSIIGLPYLSTVYRCDRGRLYSNNRRVTSQKVFRANN